MLYTTEQERQAVLDAIRHFVKGKKDWSGDVSQIVKETGLSVAVVSQVLWDLKRDGVITQVYGVNTVTIGICCQ